MIYNYKWGEPEFLDISIGSTIASGSPLEAMQKLVCDEYLRQPYVTASQLSEMRFISLQSTLDGKGEVFFKPVLSNQGTSSDLVVIRLNEDAKTATMFPSGKDILSTYRYIITRVDFDCTATNFSSPKVEYYNSDYELVSVLWSQNQPATPINVNSPIATLKRIVCSPKEVEKCDPNLKPGGEAHFNGVYLGTIEEGTEITRARRLESVGASNCTTSRMSTNVAAARSERSARPSKSPVMRIP
jgi:hypothetical protein